MYHFTTVSHPHGHWQLQHFFPNERWSNCNMMQSQKTLLTVGSTGFWMLLRTRASAGRVSRVVVPGRPSSNQVWMDSVRRSASCERELILALALDSTATVLLSSTTVLLSSITSRALFSTCACNSSRSPFVISEYPCEPVPLFSKLNTTFLGNFHPVNVIMLQQKYMIFRATYTAANHRRVSWIPSCFQSGMQWMNLLNNKIVWILWSLRFFAIYLQKNLSVTCLIHWLSFM